MKFEFGDVASLSLSGDKDPLAPPFRDPFRHPSQHGPSFRERFDYDTVLFDLFDDGAGGLAAITPPIGREAQRRDLRFSVDGRVVPFRHRRRTHLDMLELPGLADAGPVRVQSDRFDVTLAPSPSRLALFEGLRSLCVVNRDNALQWIVDFVAFHVRRHGCEAVCLYENGSTAYTREALRDALCAVEDLAVVVIVDWPFKWGVTDGNSDSAYTQRALLEHARRRYLGRARSVLQADVDELVLTAGRSIFEIVEQSATGYVSFKGRWVMPVRDLWFETLGPPRHRHFTRTDLSENGWCGKKWACVPARIPDEAQWMVHDVFGGVEPDLSDQSVTLRHFRGVNTGWKHEKRAAPDAPAPQPEARLEAALAETFTDAPRHQTENLEAAARLAFAGAPIPRDARDTLALLLTARAGHAPWLAMLAASFWERRNRDDIAAELCRNVLAADATVHEARYFLSFILERRGACDCALAEARAAFEAEPSNRRYSLRLLKLAAKQRANALCLAAAEAVLAIAPQDPIALEYKARMLAREGDAAGALETLAALPAAALGPDGAILRAELCVQLNHAAEALETLDAVIAIAPRRPWAHHVRAAALEALGRPAEALEAARRAVALNASSPAIAARLHQLEAASAD